MGVNIYGLQVPWSPKATRESAKDLITKNNGIREDTKLPDDSGEVPESNGVVGGSIPDHEVVFLLDQKPIRW